MTRPAAADRLAALAAEVGPPEAGPVVAVGGRTQWHVGAPPGGGTPGGDERASGGGTPGGGERPGGGAPVREVRAPAGVVTVEAADMTVRLGAGTTVTDLDLDAQARVKESLDPGGVFNPDKVLPRGSRCYDFGRPIPEGTWI